MRQTLCDTEAKDDLDRGFLLQPQGEEVPNGSFVVVVGDGERVAARAVYVPDEAKDARGWATTLLDAVESDAKAFGGAESELRVQGGATLAKTAWGIVAKLLPKASGAGSETAQAVARAEARMTRDTTLWKDFASHFDKTGKAWMIESMTSTIKALRKSLGDRTVVVVDSNLKNEPCSTSLRTSVGVSGCPKTVEQAFSALTERLANRNVALAVPIGAEVSPVALLWAVEKRVPSVLTSGAVKDVVRS